MGYTGFAGLFLIVINVIFTYKGLTNKLFFEGYLFEVDKVLINRDYKRIITAGFLHVSWTHLFFNMLSLYFFSGSLEAYAGSFVFLLIYFASLIGGQLLALFIHRNHGSYSAVGASGAVSGIIFASIALIPGMGISFFGILPIPGWLYGIIYILGSIYGIKSKKDNTGHEAHLGGALVGMLTILLFYPRAFIENYMVILLLALPAIIFISLVIAKPHLLLVDGFSGKKNRNHYSVDHKYNEEKSIQQKEIDRILDKIAAKGMKSLNQKEKEMLDKYSKSSR